MSSINELILGLLNTLAGQRYFTSKSFENQQYKSASSTLVSVKYIALAGTFLDKYGLLWQTIQSLQLLQGAKD
jgi:hypothetical protein